MTDAERSDRDRREGESAFLTPEDDFATLGPPMACPTSRPHWWEGLWPEHGINSMADLGRYVESRLNGLISLVWSAQSPRRDIGESFGGQAARNAVRWLNRHGDVQPPVLTSADLAHPVDIENALHGILWHIHSRQGQLSDTGPSDNAVEADPELEDKAKVAPCHRKAHGYYDLACKECARKLTDQEAYDWLAANRHKLEGDELPTFKTFSRYLRVFRRAYDMSKHTPRRGRMFGRSIARQDEI